MVRALREPEVSARLKEFGMQVYASSPSEFARFLSAERAKWEPIVRTSGATIN